jgi:hypothetical protein
MSTVQPVNALGNRCQREKGNPSEAVFFDAGEFWTIGFKDRTFALRASKGLSYIHRLILHPQEEFHSLSLISEGLDPEDVLSSKGNADGGLNQRWLSDAGEMLDSRAKQDYRQRLADLKEQLEDHIERGNNHGALQVENEIEFLTREISRAVGLGGRDRRAGSAAERARLNVTRAIKTSIQKIIQRDPAFGDALNSAIRTGMFCSYYPGRETLNWQLSRESLPQLRLGGGRINLPVERNFLSPATEQTRFIGRDQERLILLRAMERARDGNGSVVTVMGAPGVGKTRLASEFGAEAAREGFLVLSGRCYDRADQMPFNAFVEIFEQAVAQAPDREQFRRTLGNDASEISRLMPSLRQIFPDIPAPPEVPPDHSRRSLLNAFFGLLAHMAASTPLILVIDDLHWSDEGTLSMLHFIGRATAANRILIVGTYRNSESAPAGELAGVLDAFTRLHLLDQIELTNLSEALVAEMLRALSGQVVPGEFVTQMAHATDGNPFFIEELFRHLAERGGLFDADGKLTPQLEVAETGIPMSLRLVIGRRLARLGTATRKLLDIAAVIGRSFTFDLLEAAAAASVESLLEQLEEAEEACLISSTLEYPAVKFRFTHELIRQAALGDISVRRRQQLHARIATAIERIEAGRLETAIDDSTHHLVNAGGAVEADKTLLHLSMAARIAVGKSAYESALLHLRNAMQTLERIASSNERDLIEADLQLILGVALLARKGWYIPEVATAYMRARELCVTHGDERRRFAAVYGLWSYHLVKGEHYSAAAYAAELLTLAEDDSARVQAHWAEGCSRFFGGEFAAAHENFHAGTELYDSARHHAIALTMGQDPCVSSLCFDAMALWHLGLTAQAEHQAEAALRLARQLAHPFSLVWCLTMLSKYYCMRRDFDRVTPLVEEGLPLARQLGFAFWEESLGFYSNLQSAFINGVDPSVALQAGSSDYTAAGYTLAFSWAMANFAEALLRSGQLAMAEAMLTFAFDIMERNQERYSESELHRIKGEIILKNQNGLPASAVMAEAERCFQKAIDEAQSRCAPVLELRAALSLSSLWLENSRGQDARELLARVCATLNEGRDAAEYVAAQRILTNMPAKIPA